MVIPVVGEVVLITEVEVAVDMGGMVVVKVVAMVVVVVEEVDLMEEKMVMVKLFLPPQHLMVDLVAITHLLRILMVGIVTSELMPFLLLLVTLVVRMHILHLMVQLQVMVMIKEEVEELAHTMAPVVQEEVVGEVHMMVPLMQEEVVEEVHKLGMMVVMVVGVVLGTLEVVMVVDLLSPKLK